MCTSRTIACTYRGKTDFNKHVEGDFFALVSATYGSIVIVTCISKQNVCAFMFMQD